MPEISTSAELTDEEQTKECSAVFQEEEEEAAAAAATTDGSEFESFSDITLQDLPMELIEYILIKVVGIEVKSMKLSKSVWKEKADHVINRLRTVCSQWNSILTTKFFRNELNRTLDRTGHETLRMEILHQSSIQLSVVKVTSLKDEIFLLCNSIYEGDDFINVYDRNNMEVEKGVIHLPGISPIDMAACSVSNCVYVLDKERYCPSVFRITRDGENHFKVSPWIYDLRLTVSNRGPMFVSANGSLVILTRRGRPIFSLDWNEYRSASAGTYIYNVNGSLKQEITLSPDIYGFRDVNNVIQKSDGNFLLNSADDESKTRLLEIDANAGGIVRQYQSPLYEYSVAGFADIHGRIMINDIFCSRMEFLDREFNPLEIPDPRIIGDDLYSPSDIHFNMERNEIVRAERYNFDFDTGLHQTTALSIYRITEE